MPKDRLSKIVVEPDEIWIYRLHVWKVTEYGHKTMHKEDFFELDHAYRVGTNLTKGDIHIFSEILVDCPAEEEIRDGKRRPIMGCQECGKPVKREEAILVQHGLYGFCSERCYSRFIELED